MESQSTPAGTLFCCRPPLAHRNPGTPATPAAPPSLSLRTRPQPGVAIRPPLAHRNQGTPATPAAPPSLSLRTSAHAGVAIRPPASRRLARPGRGAIDLPPMGEGGRQRRPDEGCTRPNLKASLQTPKSPLSPRTKLPITPPVLPDPHPTRLRRATWNCGIPCHRQGIISNGASRLPHWGKV